MNNQSISQLRYINNGEYTNIISTLSEVCNKKIPMNILIILILLNLILVIMQSMFATISKMDLTIISLLKYIKKPSLSRINKKTE